MIIRNARLQGATQMTHHRVEWIVLQCIMLSASCTSRSDPLEDAGFDTGLVDSLDSLVDTAIDTSIVNPDTIDPADDDPNDPDMPTDTIIPDDPPPEPIPPCPVSGDVDGDGISDLVVSAFLDETVILFGESGFPGAHEFPSMTIMRGGGDEIEMCDIDGDCLWDVVIQHREIPQFHIFLGSTIASATGGPVDPDVIIDVPSVLPPPNFEFDAACLGDLDEDGYQDLAFGTDESFALMYGKSAPGGEIGLEELDATASNILDSREFSSVYVAGIGDYDGDGSMDVVVFLPLADVGLPNTYILTGWGRKSGAVSLGTDSVAFTIPRDDYIVGVQQVGDVNNDGLSDFMVCDYLADVGCSMVLGRPDPADSTPPEVDVTFFRFGSVSRGGIGIGDWTGDGIDDLLFGDEWRPGTFQGSVYFLEGRTVWPDRINWDGDFYASVSCEFFNCRLGREIAAIEDMNDDGSMEVLALGVPGEEMNIWVFAGTPDGWIPDSVDDTAAIYTGDRYMQTIATIPPFLWSSHY